MLRRVYLMWSVGANIFLNVGDRNMLSPEGGPGTDARDPVAKEAAIKTHEVGFQSAWVFEDTCDGHVQTGTS